jgi:hypothetical protein
MHIQTDNNLSSAHISFLSQRFSGSGPFSALLRLSFFSEPKKHLSLNSHPMSISLVGKQSPYHQALTLGDASAQTQNIGKISFSAIYSTIKYFE